MTSRERLFDAALGKGWSAASTSDRMVMVKDNAVITVWFTRNGRVNGAIFERPAGLIDEIRGGVPAIITELER